MLSWLKKFGLTILKDALVVLGIGEQIVPTVVPPGATETKVEDVLVDIATIITDVETEVAAVTPAGGAAPVTGAQKLQMASARANQRLQKWYAANVPGAPAVKNSALWQTGVATIVNGMVALLNSADDKADVKTTDGVKGAQVPSAQTAAKVAPQTKP
jgi:hypothetical protein